MLTVRTNDANNPTNGFIHFWSIHLSIRSRNTHNRTIIPQTTKNTNSTIQPSDNVGTSHSPDELTVQNRTQSHLNPLESKHRYIMLTHHHHKTTNPNCVTICNDDHDDDEGILVDQVCNTTSNNTVINPYVKDSFTQQGVKFFGIYIPTATITKTLSSSSTMMMVFGIAMFCVTLVLVPWLSSVWLSKHIDARFESHTHTVLNKFDHLESRSVPSFICDDGLGFDQPGCYPSTMISLPSWGRATSAVGRGGRGDSRFGFGFGGAPFRSDFDGDDIRLSNESGGSYFCWLCWIATIVVGVIMMGLWNGIDLRDMNEHFLNALKAHTDDNVAYNMHTNNSNNDGSGGGNPSHPNPLSPSRPAATGVTFTTPPRSSRSSSAPTTKQRRPPATPYPHSPSSKKKIRSEIRKRVAEKMTPKFEHEQAACGGTSGGGISSPSPHHAHPCNITNPVASPGSHSGTRSTTKTPRTPSSSAKKNGLSKSERLAQARANARQKMMGA